MKLRIDQLDQLTKNYFIESHEFLYTKKYQNKKTKKINLVFNAYNLEYNLVLKDFRIFFENKLKTKFIENTRLARKPRKKRYLINKYSLIAKTLKNDKIYDSNYDFRDITLKPNVVFKFNILRKRKELSFERRNPKKLTRLFFLTKMLENEGYKSLIKDEIF